MVKNVIDAQPAAYSISSVNMVSAQKPSCCGWLLRNMRSTNEKSIQSRKKLPKMLMGSFLQPFLPNREHRCCRIQMIPWKSGFSAIFFRSVNATINTYLLFPIYAIILSRIKSRSVRTVYTCIISHFINFLQKTLTTGMARIMTITKENIGITFFIFISSLIKSTNYWFLNKKNHSHE